MAETLVEPPDPGDIACRSLSCYRNRDYAKETKEKDKNCVNELLLVKSAENGGNVGGGAMPTMYKMPKRGDGIMLQSEKDLWEGVLEVGRSWKGANTETKEYVLQASSCASKSIWPHATLRWLRMPFFLKPAPIGSLHPAATLATCIIPFGCRVPPGKALGLPLLSCGGTQKRTAASTPLCHMMAGWNPKAHPF